MLTGELHVQHFALAIIEDLIGRFDLIQKRRYLSERVTAGRVFRLGLNDVMRR